MSTEMDEKKQRKEKEILDERINMSVRTLCCFVSSLITILYKSASNVTYVIVVKPVTMNHQHALG